MDPYRMDPEEMLEAAERRRSLDDALELMQPEERDVITALWGIEGAREDEGEVAYRLSMSRSDVREIARIAEGRIYAHVRLGRAPKHTPERHVPNAKRAPRFITPPPPRGFLYVVEFSTGIVKVGRSKRPDVRIRSHGTSAACHGVQIVREWVSEEHGDVETSEAHLIGMCDRGRRAVVGREYFRLPFAEVVQAAGVAIEKARKGPEGVFEDALFGVSDGFRGFSQGGA